LKENPRSYNPFETEKKAQSPQSTNSNPKVNSGNQRTFGSSFNKKPEKQWESLYSGLNTIEVDETSKTTASKLEFESTANTQEIFTQEDSNTVVGGVYQLHKKYLVATIKSGLVIIHQNRAHQRILYEDFRKHISQSNAISQQLLFPLQLPFEKSEIAILKAMEEELVSAGFGFKEFDEESISINGIPTVISESEVSIILEQLIADIELEVPESSFSQLEVLSKSLAKSAAVKTGAILEKEMQQHLVDQLFACEEPNRAPNGKNTYTTLSVNELDRKF